MSKNNEVLTTSANFPVQDITHKPKRMQGESFRNKGDETESNPDNSERNVDNIPDNIEGAIRYCEATAKAFAHSPKTSKLYSNIAKWLRELLVTRNPKSIVEAKSAEESLKEVTVDADSDS